MKRTIPSVTIGTPLPNLSEATERYRKLWCARNEITPVPGVVEFEMLSGCPIAIPS